MNNYKHDGNKLKKKKTESFNKDRKYKESNENFRTEWNKQNKRSNGKLNSKMKGTEESISEFED